MTFSNLDLLMEYVLHTAPAIAVLVGYIAYSKRTKAETVNLTAESAQLHVESSLLLLKPMSDQIVQLTADLAELRGQMVIVRFEIAACHADADRESRLHRETRKERDDLADRITVLEESA